MKIKQAHVWAVIFFFLVTQRGLAQTKDVEKTLKGLDEYIETAMEAWQVPGLALGIIKDGELVYAKGYGHRNREQETPVTPQTLFAIGSSSKAFTATTVCQLVDDGLLELDEPVRSYLPDFQLHNAFATEEMSPRDLLSHRSGLPRHDIVWYGADKNREEIYQSLALLEPTQAFRTRFQYQNLMYMTAGYLVEKVSGQSWEAFTQARIFDPLGMKSSNFSVDVSQDSDNYALPYRVNQDKEIELMSFRNIDAIGPAGSINSTIEDMSKWVIMQLGKGNYQGQEILSAGSLQETHTPTMIIPGVPSKEVFYRTYGLGWFITAYRGHLRVEHGGNIDGFSANVGLLPQDSIGVVVLTNLNGTPLPDLIRNVVFDRMLGLESIDWSQRFLEDRAEAEAQAENAESNEDLGQVTGTQPAHELSAYVGTYSHPSYGKIEINMGGDERLRMFFHGFEVILNHYHYEVFQTEHVLIDKQKLQFQTLLDGSVGQIKMELQAGVAPIEFDRELDPVEMSEADLQRYTGEYELSGMILKVDLSQTNKLTLTVPGQPTYTLLPAKAHEFKIKDADGFTIRFTMQDEAVTELISIQPNGTFKASRKE